MPNGEEQNRRTNAVRPEWLTARQSTDLTGLGRTTLWKLASTGQVKAAKVGKAVRFSRKSLQEFMERSGYPESR